MNAVSRFAFDESPDGVYIEGVAVGSWNGFPIVRASAVAVVRFFSELDPDNFSITILGGNLVMTDSDNDNDDGSADPYLFPIAADGTVTIDGMTWCEVQA